MKLTEKQQQFVETYIETGNATKQGPFFTYKGGW